MTKSSRYTGVAIALHWLMALVIFGMLAVGFIMKGHLSDQMLRFQLYQWHKSLGITILLLSLFRLGWRLTHRPPPLPPGMKPWEQALVHIVHPFLYALMIGMPLSGWMMVSASPRNIPTVLYGIIPWPPLPVLSTLTDKVPVELFLKQVHSAVAWVLIVTLVGHIGAALMHHFVRRDDVLLRMLPRWRKV